MSNHTTVIDPLAKTGKVWMSKSGDSVATTLLKTPTPGGVSIDVEHWTYSQREDRITTYLHLRNEKTGDVQAEHFSDNGSPSGEFVSVRIGQDTTIFMTVDQARAIAAAITAAVEPF